jgi:hypothetical protein
MIQTKKMIIFITIIGTFSLLQASDSGEKVPPKASYGQLLSNLVKETISTPESYKGREVMSFVSLALSGAGSAYAAYQLYKRIKEASETLTEFEKGKKLDLRLLPRYFIKTLLALGGLGVSSLILYHSWQQLKDPEIYNRYRWTSDWNT